MVHYNFNELNGAISDGTTIKDSSGNDHNATAKGANLTATDGKLTLPGGAYNSGAGYVELPQGIFDGQKELSISMWTQNKTGAKDCTAFYIGTGENKHNYPTSYFIFNPSNPSGYYKAVITNSENPSTPYNTEVGLAASQNAKDSFASTNELALYTIVFTETTMTGYLNGEKYKTYDIKRCIADLGSDLLSYIGKSPYHDVFYQGIVDVLCIYSEALTDDEVSHIYLDALYETGKLHQAN